MKILKKWVPLFALALLIVSLVQGNFLRRIGYFKIPEPYVILDEHAYVWYGLSIRETGVPTSWSILPPYLQNSKKYGSAGGVDGFNINIDGILPNLLTYKDIKSPVVSVFETDLGNGIHHIPLVQPDLDQPPLGAIILSLGVNKDAKTFKDVSDFDLRRSSVFIAVITQVLIAVLALQLTKNWLVALVASFSYATVPSFLFLSRYAQLENVMGPLILFLLVVLIFLNQKKDQLSNGNTNGLLILSGIVAGLVALVKLSGWIAVPLGIFLLWSWRFKKAKILMFAMPAIFIGITYFIWGLYLSPRLFQDLFVYQGITRGFIGSINLLVTMTGVNIFNFPFDGWWIGGFLSLLILPREKNLKPLFASIVLVLTSALLLGGANYPWYFIPIIPFICISIGILFNRIATNPDTTSMMTLFFVFLSSSFYWGYGVFFAAKEANNYQQPFTLYRALFVVFITLAVIFGIWKGVRRYQRLWFIMSLLLFTGLFLLNHHGIYYILNNWGKLPSLYTPGTF